MNLVRTWFARRPAQDRFEKMGHVCIFQFFPGLHAFHQAQPLFNQLLFSRLYREVRLGESDGFFRWVAVLGDEIAGVAGQHNVLY